MNTLQRLPQDWLESLTGLFAEVSVKRTRLVIEIPGGTEFAQRIAKEFLCAKGEEIKEHELSKNW
jgi:hypothetical protein